MSAAPSVDREQWISIFEYLEGRGSDDKNMMITNVSWLMPLTWGLIGFSISGDSDLRWAAGWLALLLSVYATYIVIEFMIHAGTCFKKADTARGNIGCADIEDLLSERKRDFLYDKSVFYCGRVFYSLAIIAVTSALFSGWIILDPDLLVLERSAEAPRIETPLTEMAGPSQDRPGRR